MSVRDLAQAYGCTAACMGIPHVHLGLLVQGAIYIPDLSPAVYCVLLPLKSSYVVEVSILRHRRRCISLLNPSTHLFVQGLLQFLSVCQDLFEVFILSPEVCEDLWVIPGVAAEPVEWIKP